MTLVKICGITNFEDAQAAIAAGADMLGFNFYRQSPRFIEPGWAHEIIQRIRFENRAEPPMTVGVFVDESSPEAVAEVISAVGVGGAQLHGEESAEFCKAFKQLAPWTFLIKALHVDGDFNARRAALYEADSIMLDAFHPQLRGGTGQLIDWAVARRAQEYCSRLFLAGGLSPENVTQAIALVRPYAVDACSSLEFSPGRKDPQRMSAFVRAVHSS